MILHWMSRRMMGGFTDTARMIPAFHAMDRACHKRSCSARRSAPHVRTSHDLPEFWSIKYYGRWILVVCFAIWEIFISQIGTSSLFPMLEPFGVVRHPSYGWRIKVMLTKPPIRMTHGIYLVSVSGFFSVWRPVCQVRDWNIRPLQEDLLTSPNPCWVFPGEQFNVSHGTT